jgi:hypothetical protein
MKTKDFENLVRMAVELEELERSVFAHPRTGTDSLPAISPDRSRFRRTLIQRLTAPLAAAIALLYMLLPSGKTVTPPSPARPFAARSQTVRPFDVAVCPVELAVNSEHARQPGEETLKVVAIFQTWQKECECHAWQLYEWEDDNSLADMTPEQIHTIAMDVTGATPLERLQVIAIAKNGADLPLCVPESCALVECLNQVAPSNEAQDNSAAYASAVRECLPDTVRVIPQSFSHE